jgi:hypothetical protein
MTCTWCAGETDDLVSDFRCVCVLCPFCCEPVTVAGMAAHPACEAEAALRLALAAVPS